MGGATTVVEGKRTFEGPFWFFRFSFNRCISSSIAGVGLSSPEEASPVASGVLPAGVACDVGAERQGTLTGDEDLARTAPFALFPRATWVSPFTRA